MTKERFRILVEFEIETEGWVGFMVARTIVERISNDWATKEFTKVEVHKLNKQQ